MFLHYRSCVVEVNNNDNNNNNNNNRSRSNSSSSNNIGNIKSISISNDEDVSCHEVTVRS